MSGRLIRALSLILASSVAEPQRGQVPLSETPAIRVDVGVVRVPVSVRGPLGNPVSGLHPENFRLFENGVERTIRYFSSQESPVAIGLIVDTSGSMTPKIRDTREAVARVLRTSAEGDEYFLIAFADRPRLLSDIIRDPESVLKQLPRLRASGWTALFDALDLSLRTMSRTGNNRKALLVISDGADNRSRFTETELRSRLTESDSCLYALGIIEDAQTDHNLRLLADLSSETGGIMLTARSASELPGAVEQLALHIRYQYVLGYPPATPYDGQYRRVTVQLVAPDAERMTVSHRKGYYAPSPPSKQ